MRRQSVLSLIRDSWRPVLQDCECVVHGDLGAGNVLLSRDRVVLIDWDESRVDAPSFDFAHLPEDIDIPLVGDRRAVVTAGIAWEAATCWIPERQYATSRLAELNARVGRVD